MKIPRYSVCSFLVCSFRTNVKKGYLNDNVFCHCYGNFLECAILKVTFDHNYVQNSFSRIVKDIENSILKEILQFKILRTWIKTCYRSSRPEVFLGKISENRQQIHKRTPMLKCDFNKVALHLY